MTSRRVTLPALPYDYGALEPHIEHPLLEWHHLHYHGGLVDRIHELSAVRGGQQRQRELARCCEEHRLHSVFWCNLDPRGGRAPLGELHDVICEAFGDVDLFREALNSRALRARTWVALAVDLDAGGLCDIEIDLLAGPHPRRIPIMVVDVAEHAYAAQYGRDKAEYLDALWHLWNWQDIAERFRDAQPARRYETGVWP